MQFEHNRANHNPKNVVSEGRSESLPANPYQYCINFYTIPPTGKLSLEDGEDMVTERLNLLRVCDEMLKSLENNSNFRRGKSYYEILQNRLQNSESKYDKNFYLAAKSNRKSLDIIQARRRDHMSHFLLRLYYCRKDELRKWFISRECELLRARLMDKTITVDLPVILRKYGFIFDEVSVEERRKFNRQINWKAIRRSVVTQTVYKIPFEESVEPVRHRTVFLKSGFAYIAIKDMVSVICAKFRSELSRSLAKMQKILPHLDEDQRLIPRLNSLHSHYIESRKSSIKSENESEAITPQMIDSLSNESFPPCMRTIHEVLRKEHHLRYYGRLHYGLFLKSVGLSLDDALIFFREEFIKKIAPEKFQKEYSYYIRYNYGKEGKKQNTSAYGCQKILNNNAPGPGDCHGCPFKHFDETHLKQMLRKHKISETDSQNILEIVTKESDYTKACSRYFSSRHSWYPTINIYHPNKYYSQSRKALSIPNMTPPENQELISVDMSTTADTTTDSMADESMFEMEDEFDRSVAAMDFQTIITEESERVSNISEKGPEHLMSSKRHLITKS